VSSPDVPDAVHDGQSGDAHMDLGLDASVLGVVVQDDVPCSLSKATQVCQDQLRQKERISTIDSAIDTLHHLWTSLSSIRCERCRLGVSERNVPHKERGHNANAHTPVFARCTFSLTTNHLLRNAVMQERPPHLNVPMCFGGKQCRGRIEVLPTS
jgi:hypothetical protein